MFLLWAVLLVAGVLADVKTGALVGVWLAVAAVGGAAAAGFGLPAAVQAAVFVTLSAALLGAVRPLALRHRVPAAPTPALLLGKFATVLDPVDDQLASGRILVEGVSYVARCVPGTDPLPAGASARVCGVESGDIVVERI